MLYNITLLKLHVVYVCVHLCTCILKDLLKNSIENTMRKRYWRHPHGEMSHSQN